MKIIKPFHQIISRRSRIITLVLLAFYCSNIFSQNKITLTWKVDDINIPKTIVCLANGEFTVNWGDGIIETFADFVPILHSYNSADTFDVTIATLSTSFTFLWFFCYDNQISKITFIECSALTNLLCSNNQLTNLDLSGCVALSSLTCSNNHITNINLSGCSFLSDLKCNSNIISELDLSDCIALEYLNCDDNQITELYLSSCSALDYISCSNNQLSKIDLSNENVVQTLVCANNQLQLSDLYKTQSVLNDYYARCFGTQYLPSMCGNIDTEFFSDQSSFAGVLTNYYVEKDGNPAPNNTYSATNGKLTFHMLGSYTVTMTNDAIVSHPSWPAAVIVPFEIVPVGVKELKELEGVNVYPNPTTGELNMEYGILNIESVEIFDVYGRKQKAESRKQNGIDISDLPNGVYFMKINTEAGETIKKIVKY